MVLHSMKKGLIRHFKATTSDLKAKVEELQVKSEKDLQRLKNGILQEQGRKTVQESRNKNGMILTGTSHKYLFPIFVIIFFFSVLDFEVNHPSNEHSQYG